MLKNTIEEKDNELKNMIEKNKKEIEGLKKAEEYAKEKIIIVDLEEKKRNIILIGNLKLKIRNLKKKSVSFYLKKIKFKIK